MGRDSFFLPQGFSNWCPVTPGGQWFYSKGTAKDPASDGERSAATEASITTAFFLALAGSFFADPLEQSVKEECERAKEKAAPTLSWRPFSQHFQFLLSRTYFKGPQNKSLKQ